jgi:hypothetical protein
MQISILLIGFQQLLQHGLSPKLKSSKTASLGSLKPGLSSFDKTLL